MAAITIDESDGQVTYSVGGTPSTGPFDIDFPYFFASEISVVVRDSAGDETTLVLDDDFTVTGTAADDGFSGGSITLDVAVSSSTVVITRELSTTKATNFPTSGLFSIRVLNTLLSRLFSWTQDLRRKYSISLHFPAGETVSAQLPAVVDRKGYVLAFHATTGAPILSSQTLDDIESGSTDAAASAAAAAASAGAAATSAGNAATSETNAAASAATAANLAVALSGTSTTSLLVATGSKVFTTQAGKSFAVGSYVIAASTATPANFMLGQVTAYSGTSLTVNVTTIGSVATKADWNIQVSGVQGATGATGSTGATGTTGRSDPGGRITFTTGVPIQSSNVTPTTIYYTPFVNDLIPLYNGSAWAASTFTELSNDLTASSTGKAGPAAASTNKNYDLFVWDDSGTLRLTRGPAWSSDTARGTGAGTSELQQVNGIWTNKQAITNGPAANRGTYIGSIRTNGSSQAAWNAGGSASGGQAAIMGLWNAYNRVRYYGKISDTTVSWSYGTNTWRSADNSTAMRVSWIAGLQYDYFIATYDALLVTGSGKGQVGVGLDSTSTPSGLYGTSGTTNAYATFSELNDRSLGFHFAQALERASDATALDYYSDGTGLTFDGWF